MKQRRRKGPAMQRPYAERLQAMHDQEIGDHRQDSAEVAIKLACLTLNEIDHWGFRRLARFCQALMDNVREYYSDRERMEYWVDKRFEKMGFLVTEEGGIKCCVDREGNPIRKEAFEKCEKHSEKSAKP